MLTLWQIFVVYLRLGCTSFGGPVAHLAYFKEEIVGRRGWLTESRYADLLALCQFLPGPSSSQLGFALAWEKRGLAGGLAAWAGFTLPSAIIMLALAYGVQFSADLFHKVLPGLLVVASAVVAHATWNLGKRLCPDLPRLLLALGATGLLLRFPGSLMQLLVLLLGGLAGVALWRKTDAPCPEAVVNSGNGKGLRTGLWSLALCFVLLACTFVTTTSGLGQLLNAHYQTGALVIGGGHVMLPLLHERVVATGLATEDSLLLGYGAAQALPGPLFTFAAYLGGVSETAVAPWLGGLLCLGAIFLPGMLLVVGVLPFWAKLRARPAAQAALRGANAAVVGLLLAALLGLVLPKGVTNGWQLAGAAVCFVILWKKWLPPWALVLLAGLSAYATN